MAYQSSIPKILAALFEDLRLADYPDERDFHFLQFQNLRSNLKIKYFRHLISRIEFNFRLLFSGRLAQS